MDKGSRSQAAGVGGGVGQPGGQSAGAPAYNMAVISYESTFTFVFCYLIFTNSLKKIDGMLMKDEIIK